MNTDRKTRILIGKAGLDAHTRGVSILIKRLRDAGMEVIYTGRFQSPETMVSAAIQEDVDFIFLSDHLGSHIALSRSIIELLKEKGAEHIGLVVGGLVPQRDIPTLKAMGAKGAFPPHTLPSVVIDFVHDQVNSLA